MPEPPPGWPPSIKSATSFSPYDTEFVSVTLTAPAAFGPRQQHAASIRNGFRMANKFRKNQDLARAVHDYLESTYDVVLPADRKDFNATKREVLKFDHYDGDALEVECDNLIKLYYALRISRGYYAEFETPDAARLVPLAFMYSKNRLDYAWNMRKSQLVRNRYWNYLQEATDEYGNKLTDYYQPIHLTLTVPHSGGEWRGVRFYARQLIKAFAELRKTLAWRHYIYAGEYGIEVKRSKHHGLHIHLHCFLLQKPVVKVIDRVEFPRKEGDKNSGRMVCHLKAGKASVNDVRTALSVNWRAIMDNVSGYSGMHYETLFTYQKDDQGKVKRDSQGRKIKTYIIPGHSKMDDYLAGVLECIKYHFKPDCLDKANDGSGYDVKLIKEILDNTRNLRMYSRFGAFYKQPDLNFNQLHEDGPAVDELSTEAADEEVKATTDGVQERLVDPRTYALAAPGSYKLKAGHPLSLRYYAKSGDRPGEPYYLARAAPPLLEVPPGLNLKQAIKLDIKGALERLNQMAKATDARPDQVQVLSEWLDGSTGGQRPRVLRTGSDAPPPRGPKPRDPAMIKRQKDLAKIRKMFREKGLGDLFGDAEPLN